MDFIFSGNAFFEKRIYIFYFSLTPNKNHFSFFAEIQKFIRNKNKEIQRNRNKMISLPPLSYELSRNSASFAR